MSEEGTLALARRPIRALLAPFLFPDTARFVPVPPQFAHMVAPAEVGLFEWTDYHFHFPGAHALRVDGATVQKLAPHVWRVRWENRAGAARVVPDAGEALAVEVLSPKFPTFAAHIGFFAALWRELAARFPPLLWQAGGGTMRGALVARGQPSPEEVLDWLQMWGEEMEAVGRALERQPSLSLRREEVEAPVEQARRIEGGQLSAMLSGSWERSGSRALPRRVLQERWHDSPSPLLMRFGDLAARVVQGVGPLPEGATWRKRLGAWGKPCATLPPLLARDPLAVRVLALEAAYGVAQTPVWGPIERAARLRDVATLWEWWVLLALVRELEAATGERADWGGAFDVQLGLRAPALLGFGARSLLYNGATPSYSTPLRPDFVLRDGAGRPVAALDAKFRVSVERGSVVGDDLHKMHAYRDALGVRVAVALHPGERSVFYDQARGPLAVWNLRAALGGALSGVGAWGLRP